MSGPKILQDPREIDALAEIVRRETCASLLEIGSNYGGSLLRLAMAMPVGARVVSVDLPSPGEGKESEASLRAVVDGLKGQGYAADLIIGDSTDPKIVDRVTKQAPFDLVFIDGNHTLAYIEKDWANYGSLGRIVAFHDISWFRNSTWVGARIDVPLFWNTLRSRFRHEEFRFCPTGKNNGIGVIWR